MANSQSNDLFEKEIRPLLASHCYACHGAKKQEGQLRLDSPAAIRQGGVSGNTLVPLEPESSLLFRAVEYKDEALQMPPPPNDRLSPRQVALLATWIKLGAPMPKSEGIQPQTKVDNQQILKGKAFWSFKSPDRVPIPSVDHPAWVDSPIDSFIVQRLEQELLAPVPVADRQTVIRRVSFDLTGLPPTPEEVLTFVADDSPDAYDRLIDRALASPAHGVRWGRHWLDVARYSDSNGLDENVAFGNAWRYRDYVIDSLNADKPYDQFITEQLAGDIVGKLTPHIGSQQRQEALVATGFLSLGPKVLAEVDELKMEMDIVDEQIDTFGKAVLGLTLGCARCHDHKFDPVSMEDYYALAGIFRSTRTMEHFKKVARWHEHAAATAEELARKSEFDTQVTERNKVISQLVAAATESLKSQLKEGETLPEKPETQFAADTREKLKKLRDELKEFEKSAPEMSSVMGVTEGTIADVPIHVRGSHLTLGKLVSRRFPQVLPASSYDEIPIAASGRLELARWLVDPQHPLTTRVIVNRIWRWHFGSGLVRSVDNFGILGERPSHPELLDFLAGQLPLHGWSLKRLHRDLVLSRSYQLSSDRNLRLAEVDPDNRLRARAEIRRLEAEVIRDSLLFVSGAMDNSMGGSLLHVKNRQYFFDHTSLDKTKYDSVRRSIYLPVVRNNLYDVFQLFDYSDAAVPNGSRDSTVVAPQALFMMNSDFVIACARRIADSKVGRAATDDSSQIRHLYLQVLGRDPDSSEVETGVEMLRRLSSLSPSSDSSEAWVWFTQSLLGSNEFMYIR